VRPSLEKDITKGFQVRLQVEVLIENSILMEKTDHWRTVLKTFEGICPF
jgi:hypothetical protein